MSFNKIAVSQFKTLPLRRKILSEWVFPLGEDFGTEKNANAKNLDINELSALTLPITPNIDAKNETGSYRVQTYPFLSEVSQKNDKPQNPTVIRSRNSSNGAFLHPLSTKHSTLYKKRIPSTDVSNINELNITSYRNFKIRSPLKRSKNKNNSTSLKESILEKKLIVSQKSTRIRVAKIVTKKKYPEGEQLSTISNLKLKYKKTYNTLEIQSKVRNPCQQVIGLTQRKNSICAWEDHENLIAFQ